MKKTVLIFLLAVSYVAGSQTVYKYEDYFYYKHNLFLQTPSVLLAAAGYKAMAGDTAAAVQLIKDATARGMYDTGYITGNTRIKFVTQTIHWTTIKNTIRHNRQAFGVPASMQVVTSDIDNFWKVFEKLDRPDADKIFMNEYILKGSQGLRTFYEVRMAHRVISLVDAVRKRKSYYQSIRPVTQKLGAFKPRMLEAAKQLKALYSDAIFPPTTFSIGMFGAFGTADGGAGQLIGAEFLCDTNHVDTTLLNNWERSVISDTSRILGILVHELIHIQQETASDNSRLARCVNEGAADFITQLVLGYNLNDKIHLYGNAHEKELWEKFKPDMYGTNVDDWLYNGSNDKGVPGDLGYYVGYKICEAYYKKAADKKKAVREILNIKDYKAFFEESNYTPE